jgi:hypothetical protein
VIETRTVNGITVNIRPGEAGLIVADSPDLKGLHVAARDEAELNEELPVRVGMVQGFITGCVRTEAAVVKWLRANGWSEAADRVERGDHRELDQNPVTTEEA